MKFKSVVCCVLMCGLFACSKNSSKLPDTTIPRKYFPGDTMELRGNVNGGDQTVLLYSQNGDVAEADFPAFAAFGKGFNGNEGRYRSLMKFRIRHIDEPSLNYPPPVKKAVLYLYQYYPAADFNPYRLQQNTDNAAALYRIGGDWSDSTVTWSTQPSLAQGTSTSPADVVILPAVATPQPSGAADNLEVDVTEMMQNVFSNRENKGLLLKMVNEDVSSGRSFGSFACPNVNKRPKLVIYF